MCHPHYINMCLIWTFDVKAKCIWAPAHRPLQTFYSNVCVLKTSLYPKTTHHCSVHPQSTGAEQRQALFFVFVRYNNLTEHDTEDKTQPCFMLPPNSNKKSEGLETRAQAEHVDLLSPACRPMTRLIECDSSNSTREY